MEEVLTRIETVRKLRLKPGDLLHVTIGGDVGDDGEPWIPSMDCMERWRDDWARVLPEGVTIILTHHLVDSKIITQEK